MECDGAHGSAGTRRCVGDEQRGLGNATGDAFSDDSGPGLKKHQIVAGMSRVKGSVGTCFERFKVPGMAEVHVVLASDGNVKDAETKGVFEKTPTGSCVSAAVKTAR